MQYEAGMTKTVAELKAMELLKAKYPDLVKIDFKD